MVSGLCSVRSQSMMAAVMAVPVMRMAGCLIWKAVATVTMAVKNSMVSICFLVSFSLLKNTIDTRIRRWIAMLT